MSEKEKNKEEDIEEKKEGRWELYGDSKKGGKEWNEDSIFHFQSKDGKVVVGGVFDGHGGYNGLLASKKARDFCQEYFEEKQTECQQWSEDEWDKKMIDLFTATHSAIRAIFLQGVRYNQEPDLKRVVDGKGIVRTSSGDPVHGGTTASLIILVRKKTSNWLITANVGDSHGFLLCGKKQQLLTVDHGPESQEEYERVQSLPEKEYPTKLMFVYDKSNCFRKYECPLVFLKDGTKDQKLVANPWGNGLHPTNVRYEPAVYAVTPREITKDSTCIAMTRALGDFYAQQFGLTYKPDVIVLELSQSVEYSVWVASDGIWDCWKYDDFAQYVNDQFRQFGSEAVQKVGAETLRESVSRAITNFGAKHYDDSALVGWKIPAKENIDKTNDSSSGDEKI